MAYCKEMTLPKFDIALKRGSVWLAGAGPGDPGLLTLHAFKRSASGRYHCL